MQGEQTGRPLARYSRKQIPTSRISSIACSDIRADLPKIACPTLVITTQKSGLDSVEDTRAWQQAIPNSALRVLPGNSDHVAASDPERCAQETLEFSSRNAAP